MSSDSSFPESDTRLARGFKALAHPARLTIVKMLAEHDECVCGEIVDDLPLAQSTVSQHLKALREAGLVRGSEEGRCTCYCLDPDMMSVLASQTRAFFEMVDSSPSDSC